MATTRARFRTATCARLAAAAALLAASSLAVACTGASQDAASSESDLTADGGPDAGREAEAGSGDGGEGGAASLDGGATANAFVDPRDGQSYPTMTLGAKTWLARNLNFKIAGSSFCYGDDPASCARDGRLYTFTAAKTACATGWHLGSDADWKSLESALGMAASQLDLEGYSTVRGHSEGTAFKGDAGMAGYRTGTTYDAQDDRTYFWTSTTRGSDVWRRRVAVGETTIFRFTNPPQGFAISVRCVKD
ncbi:MAG: putative lipoprotein [Myxococcaceae bacterium]|nr:putative lipoprotein [Myxococcaceae bacterium]MEA2752801.1 hypothetical protein [Myxococcales bacterium]